MNGLARLWKKACLWLRWRRSLIAQMAQLLDRCEENDASLAEEIDRGVRLAQLLSKWGLVGERLALNEDEPSRAYRLYIADLTCKTKGAVNDYYQSIPSIR